MELEPKITEVELIRNREKKHVEPQALKKCKLHLSLIKEDRHKITILLTALLLVRLKGNVRSRVLLTRKLTVNVRTEGLLILLHEVMRRQLIEHVLRQDKEIKN